MIASEGPAVDNETANAAPIINTAAPALGPTLNWEPVPDLPPELQPFPGDILLSKAFWPWEDLGAKGIPEHWLYMSRRVQGTIAMLAVQTPNGPKLANALETGTLVSAPLKANYKPVSFNQALPVGAYTAIEPSGGGLADTIYGISYEQDAALAAGPDVILQTDPGFGTVIKLVTFRASRPEPRFVWLGGITLAQGQGWGFLTEGAAAPVVAGTVLITSA